MYYFKLIGTYIWAALRAAFLTGTRFFVGLAYGSSDFLDTDTGSAVSASTASAVSASTASRAASQSPDTLDQSYRLKPETEQNILDIIGIVLFAIGFPALLVAVIWGLWAHSSDAILLGLAALIAIFLGQKALNRSFRNYPK